MSVESTHKTCCDLIDGIDAYYDGRADRAPSYVRFGDGELMAMKGKAAVAQQPLFPALVEELRHSFNLQDDGYMVAHVAGVENEPGMRPGLFARFSNDADLVQTAAAFGGSQVYYHATALHYKLVFDPEWLLSRLQNAFDGKKLVLICGETVADHIEKTGRPGWLALGVMPDSNAYGSLNADYPAILKMANRYDGVLLAVGFTSNCIGYRLWMSGYKRPVIDVGSIADCMAGLSTRRWIKMFDEMKGGGVCLKS